MALERFAKRAMPENGRSDDLEKRIAALINLSTRGRAHEANEALTQLSEAFEELRAAGERLREQNEELAAGRVILEGERRRYIDLFDFAPDGHLVTNKEGIVEEANRAVASLLGIRKHRLTGKPLAVFVEPKHRSFFRAHLSEAQTLGSGQVRESEMLLRPRNRPPFVAALRYAGRRDAHDKLTGFRWMVRDITERKQAEQRLEEGRIRLERAYTLLEAVTIGAGVIVASVDTDFRYTFFNEAYREEMKRLTGKEISIGSSLKKVLAHMPEQLDAAERQWGRTLRGEGRAYRIEFGDPGRHRRIYDVRQTPLYDAAGNVIGAGEVAWDATSRAQAEEALRESEEKLRSSVEQLERFNRAMVGRELRMVELKKEVNELCQKMGETARYRIEGENQTT